MPRRKTQQEVIAEFRGVHGEFYDYSHVVYVNTHTKVKVVCPVHGEFEVTPGHHIKGVGCRKCFDYLQRTTKEEFVARARRHFGDRYDYSLFGQPPPFGEKVRILCRAHSVVFRQEPRNHMQGHVGCPRCKSMKLAGPRNERGTIKSSDELKSGVIKRARMVHGSAYDYSEFEYVNASIKGKIICPKPGHGEFWQSPSNHLRGNKCPACSREERKADTFRKECEAAGVDYWRALKRREAGLSKEKIFNKDYVRGAREVNEITVFGVKYPNVEEAARILKPPATCTTIGRWIKKGMPAEKAFQRVPNPGYARGIIYLITHKASGRRYVGQTIQTLERRWEYHLEQAWAGHIKGAESLHAAIREYGADAFEIRQIDEGTTKIDLGQRERHWIKTLRTLVPRGYNISPGGESGGSNKIPTEVDGILFESRRRAIEHISSTRRISLKAAKGRLQHNRIDVKAPAKPGESLVKTPVYKAWSRIVHCVVNPKSKTYRPDVELHSPWRDFATFMRDAGHPPAEGMAFARLDQAKGFYPENCRWQTKSEASKINAAYMKKAGTLIGWTRAARNRKRNADYRS
jgi:group I intron endonuclease